MGGFSLGNLTFSTGHLGRKHVGWVGMLVEVTFDRTFIAGCYYRFVRSSEHNESILCRLADEGETLADLDARSCKLGARFTPEGDRVRIMP